MNNQNRYVNETEQQKQAFELYYRLGLKRKYATVGEKFGKSISTIKNWSRAFNWRQRIEEREAERMRVVGESPGSDKLQLAKRLLAFVQGAQGSTMRDLAEGKTKPAGSMFCDALEERIALEPGFDENNPLPVFPIIYDPGK
ncbi:MAG: hypothetical protein ABII79_09320 [bacterium]